MLLTVICERELSKTPWAESPSAPRHAECWSSDIDHVRIQTLSAGPPVGGAGSRTHRLPETHPPVGGHGLSVAGIASTVELEIGQLLNRWPGIEHSTENAGHQLEWVQIV